MDIERNTTTSNPLRPFERVQVKKTCPKCGSYFVTKKECESCGFQFWIDLLGEPFGERSFFNLRDQFQHQYRWHYRFAFLSSVKTSKVAKRYKRSLYKRFEILCGYFFDEFDKDKERRKLFLFEATEIMNEVCLWGGSLSQLWLMLERGEHHPLFQVLSQELKGLDNQEKTKIDIKDLMVSEKFFGTFSYLFLFKISLGFSAVIGASYLFLKLLLSY
jgi:hypothetical protein